MTSALLGDMEVSCVGQWDSSLEDQDLQQGSVAWQ